MALGMDDEFDYLEDSEEKKQEVAEAPIIRGAKPTDQNDSLIPSEDSDETAEELAEEETELEEAEKIVEEQKKSKPKREFSSSIFVVKVTTNKEDKALELIADKIKKKKLDVFAIARPHGLRGYIFLESPDRENAEEAVFNLPYVKGIIPSVISYEEIKQMLEPVASEIKIEKNDIVEIISEPFKKEKAKVVRLDKGKGEAVVSLLGAAVPIPVTVKLDNLRVIRREEGEEIEELNSNPQNESMS
tara:strand:- start:781 stop:1515 length:735 start_codon:yes stop_codon:yes gene_type:complete